MNKEYKDGDFESPENMNYQEVIRPYQEAFSKEPWYEVSKCVDQEVPQRCPGGLSSVAIGEVCTRCGLTPLLPAYEAEELTARFEQLATTRPTRWYTERVSGEVAMAAVAWKTTSQTVTKEKYADVPTMDAWLKEQLGDPPLIWLDEVFANKSVRGSGNLKNFGAMCRGFSSTLETGVIAFRTINEAMIRAAQRDFGDRAIIVRSEEKLADEVGMRVPDRRDFVIINLAEVE